MKRNRKWLRGFLAISAIGVICLSGILRCSRVWAEEETEVTEAAETAEATEAAEAFTYTGTDPLMPAVCRWMEEELGKAYESGEIFVPAPVVFFTDKTSPEDIRIWGNFWIYRYNLVDGVLVCECGGANPGILHLRATGEEQTAEETAGDEITTLAVGGYEVIGFEAAEEGTDFEDSLKELFAKAPEEAGDLYEIYCQAGSVGRNENVRKKFLAMYAAESPEEITAYQDFGWDPVPLSADEDS